jgi:hypothetical protein
MARGIAALALAAVLLPTFLFGQYGRRTRGPLVSNPGAYNAPAVTFQGILKTLSKKELRIDVEPAADSPNPNSPGEAAEEKSLTFRVSGKTHFTKDGKDIKPSAITLGTKVAVDAIRDPDLKFSAVNVIVSPPKPKSPDQ